MSRRQTHVAVDDEYVDYEYDYPLTKPVNNASLALVKPVGGGGPKQKFGIKKIAKVGFSGLFGILITTALVLILFFDFHRIWLLSAQRVENRRNSALTKTNEFACEVLSGKVENRLRFKGGDEHTILVMMEEYGSKVTERDKIECDLAELVIREYQTLQFIKEMGIQLTYGPLKVIGDKCQEYIPYAAMAGTAIIGGFNMFNTVLPIFNGVRNVVGGGDGVV